MSDENFEHVCITFIQESLQRLESRIDNIEKICKKNEILISRFIGITSAICFITGFLISILTVIDNFAYLWK